MEIEISMAGDQSALRFSVDGKPEIDAAPITLDRRAMAGVRLGITRQGDVVEPLFLLIDDVSISTPCVSN